MVQGGWMSVEVHFSWCFFLLGCSEKAVNVPWLSRGEWIQAVDVNELWEEKLKVNYHHWLLILRAHIREETQAPVVPIFKNRTHVISVMKWVESTGADPIPALKSWQCLSRVLSLTEACTQCWENNRAPGWGGPGPPGAQPVHSVGALVIRNTSVLGYNVRCNQEVHILLPSM